MAGHHQVPEDSAAQDRLHGRGSSTTPEGQSYTPKPAALRQLEVVVAFHEPK